MKEEIGKRFLLSSIKDVKDHNWPLRGVMPYVSKDFILANNVDPSPFVNSIFHPNVPYRLDDYRFVFFRKANTKVVVNLQEMYVKDNTVGFVAPGSILEAEKIEQLSSVSAFVLSESYIKEVMGGRLPLAISGVNRNFYFPVSPADIDFCDHLIYSLRQLVEQEDYSRETVSSLFAALVNYVCWLYDRSNVGIKSNMSRQQLVFQNFIQLVNEYGSRHHNLDFYAERLCMTERYLGVVVKQQSGVGAKEWLDRAIIADAKIALKHGQESVAQLSERFCFPTPSLFCRYFKRLTGMTPTEFRNEK